jgi:hypothetical protein
MYAETALFPRARIFGKASPRLTPMREFLALAMEEMGFE